MQEKPKTLFFHIGHGKTGTTATQNMLSIVSPELKEQGICYHVPPEMKALAKSGKIQSGNLMVRLDLDIEDADREVTKRITDVTRENPDCDAFIFSSEYLFDRFPNTLPKIHQEFASKYNIVVIVVVREPTEMLTSLYSQLVKRHGFYGEVEQAAELVFHLTGAANVLTTCKSLGVQANVLNYSVEKKNISARLMSIFGVPDLLQAEAEKVLVSPSNRSLTYWETEIIKSINRVFGAKHGLKTSDALVEGLPDISSEVIEVSSSAVEKVIRQNAEAAKVVNEYLDANKKIRLLNKVGQSPAKHADLTEKQFDTVFGLCIRVLAMRNSCSAIMSSCSAIMSSCSAIMSSCSVTMSSCSVTMSSCSTKKDTHKSTRGSISEMRGRFVLGKAARCSVLVNQPPEIRQLRCS